MWEMPLHLHVNQKSDYDDMMSVIHCLPCFGECIAIDNSLHIWFTDLNESIMMFPNKINQILLCICLFPVSTAQTTNSFFSESNFHPPLRTSRLKILRVMENFHSP